MNLGSWAGYVDVWVFQNEWDWLFCECGKEWRVFAVAKRSFVVNGIARGFNQMVKVGGWVYPCSEFVKMEELD